MTAEAHTRRERAAANTEAVEDYAKTIYALAGRESGPVGTTALAEMLGVSPGTVTAMLKRMSEGGLVEYEPYHGVGLTEAGERVALEVIRHHRLLESYLAEALDMPWDRVHDEAEVLEHYISEDLEQLIAKKLGDPSRDPARGPDSERRARHHRRGDGSPDRARGGRPGQVRARLGPRRGDAALPRPARNPSRRRVGPAGA